VAAASQKLRADPKLLAELLVMLRARLPKQPPAGLRWETLQQLNLLSDAALKAYMVGLLGPGRLPPHAGC
jgi:hypothetical protein